MVNKFRNFLIEIAHCDTDLVHGMLEAYDAIYETITEPMQHLKKSVNYVDSSTVAKLQQYIKYFIVMETLQTIKLCMLVDVSAIKVYQVFSAK